MTGPFNTMCPCGGNLVPTGPWLYNIPARTHRSSARCGKCGIEVDLWAGANTSRPFFDSESALRDVVEMRDEAKRRRGE